MRIVVQCILIVVGLLALGSAQPASANPQAKCDDTFCAFLPLVARPGTAVGTASSTTPLPATTTIANPPVPSNTAAPSGTIIAATPVTSTAIPTQTTASTAAPTQAATSTSWLVQLNTIRTAAGLRPVAENATLSSANDKHVNYMLLNPSDFQHSENANLPGYTPEGDQAARQSNLFKGSPSYGSQDALNGWVESLPHRFGMLQPELATSGFAFRCNAQGCAGALNVISGIQGDPQAPKNVVYPGDKQQNVQTNTISWQFGPFDPAVTVSVGTLRDDKGNLVATTVVPANGFYNIVALKPVAALTANTTYTVDMTVLQGTQTLHKTWSFKTK